MTKSGEFDGKYREYRPISVDDALKIKKELDEIKEGRQKTNGMFAGNYYQGLSDDFVGPIVSFLGSRIVIDAGILSENGTVRLGDISSKLRESNEGQDKSLKNFT